MTINRVALTKAESTEKEADLKEYYRAYDALYKILSKIQEGFEMAVDNYDRYYGWCVALLDSDIEKKLEDAATKYHLAADKVTWHPSKHDMCEWGPLPIRMVEIYDDLKSIEFDMHDICVLWAGEDGARKGLKAIEHIKDKMFGISRKIQWWE